MSSPVSQIPATDPLFDLPRAIPAELKRWLSLPMGWSYIQYLEGQEQRTQQTAQRLIRTTVPARSTSIGTTPFTLPALAAGLYRVTFYFRITVADGVSSSLLVTISSTDGAIACLQASTAYAGNATNRPQSGSFLVRCDGATPLNYATTYVSGGGGPAMQYSSEFVVEATGG